MKELKDRIESLPDELTVADIAKAFRKAAKRFCGDQNLSLDNAAQIRCVSNMAANTIWDLILKDREAANEKVQQMSDELKAIIPNNVSFWGDEPMSTQQYMDIARGRDIPIEDAIEYLRCLDHGSCLTMYGLESLRTMLNSLASEGGR